MPGKVFVSYRRDDSAGHAGRVHDRLVAEFGRDLLFMDVDAIPLGSNFAKVLKEEVGKCDTLLAVIGPSWLDVRDVHGRRRLDDPTDFVRVEIGAALQRDIPVIPILLEGTSVPSACDLPEDLKDLAMRNGLDVRHVSFHPDMDKLIQFLKGRSGAAGPVGSKLSTHAGSAPALPAPGSGRWFKDIGTGPEMVVVPAGEFTMGSNDYDDEKPLHTVTIRRPFAVGRFAVTFAEWDASGLPNKPDDLGWGRGRRPAINVSWHDARDYANWLSQKTGKDYRLLSEAEWEYCCRAGTTTRYAFGDTITHQQAQFSAKQTKEVGMFPPNAWGLHDMHGNVWEWCEDNWHSNYQGAPDDGSVWQGGDSSLRVLRGGSWYSIPVDLRSANCYSYRPVVLSSNLGFRVARAL